MEEDVNQNVIEKTVEKSEADLAEDVDLITRESGMFSLFPLSRLLSTFIFAIVFASDVYADVFLSGRLVYSSVGK